jgi:hypothetical protein
MDLSLKQKKQLLSFVGWTVASAAVSGLVVWVCL